MLKPGSMGRRNKVKTMKAAGAGVPGAVDIPAAAAVAQVKNEVDEENDAVMMAAVESPMIVPSSDDVTLDTTDGEEELVGSDQTSADYYFDSYAHFGKRGILFISLSFLVQEDAEVVACFASLATRFKIREVCMVLLLVWGWKRGVRFAIDTHLHSICAIAGSVYRVPFVSRSQTIRAFHGHHFRF